jgi:hypothetical protein
MFVAWCRCLFFLLPGTAPALSISGHVLVQLAHLRSEVRLSPLVQGPRPADFIIGESDSTEFFVSLSIVSVKSVLVFEP